MEDDKAKVSDFWGVDRRGPRPTAWLTHPTTRAWLNRRVTSGHATSSVQWLKDVYFPRTLDRTLSLGCGFGDFDRSVVALGIAERIDAVDVSAGAIERAKAAAREAGVADRIHYAVADLDAIELPARSFDAIFGISSIHHVRQLERLFARCRHALKPGGLLVLDEYVGPARFQSDPKVFAIMNRLLGLLPARYRRNLFVDDGSTIDHLQPTPLEHFEANDPSEAVRSIDIVPTLSRYFEIVEFRPYGGAILHLLLSGIAGNFHEDDEGDVLALSLLATFEELLEEHGVIGSDFAVIVARPRHWLTRWRRPLALGRATPAPGGHGAAPSPSEASA